MNQIIVLIFALIMTGNVMAAMSSEKLEERAAFSLGLKKGDFSISNTKADGIRTEFLVTTKTEVEYNGYVIGGLGIVPNTVCMKNQMTESLLAMPYCRQQVSVKNKNESFN